MLSVTKPESVKESRMDTHKNARLTPHCRGLLVGRVMKGQPKVQVAAQFGVSIRTVDKLTCSPI